MKGRSNIGRKAVLDREAVRKGRKKARELKRRDGRE